MSYPINYPTPQGANVQIFKEGGSTSDWVKPQGASFVWFTLIGGGGSGAGTDGSLTGGGGGSGAVTNCMVPAFLIPDVLQVSVGQGGKAGSAGASGTASSVIYQQKSTGGYTLLNADFGTGGNGGGGAGGTGGVASASNYFSCMGFFQSVAGQDGTSSAGGAVTASATTFLSGGSGGSNTTTTANYGYTGVNTLNGGGSPSQLQPIIMSCGGAGGNRIASGFDPKGQPAGFGSGGGGGFTNSGTSYFGGKGGDGLVVIITW